jgi:hypothetical protein
LQTLTPVHELSKLYYNQNFYKQILKPFTSYHQIYIQHWDPEQKKKTVLGGVGWGEWGVGEVDCQMHKME